MTNLITGFIFGLFTAWLVLAIIVIVRDVNS
jgi:hypothetical protein